MTTAAANPKPERMISIAGHVGSGKSTVARMIAAATGREVFSTGRVFRQMAEDRGMTVLQLNEHARTHPEIDAEVDDHLRRLAGTAHHLVIDSRMAWFFVPESFKVFLVVDPEVGGGRVHGAGRTDEHYGSRAAAAAESKRREQVEAQRYRDLYGVTRDDWTNYDLIVDTTDAAAELVVASILETLAARGDEPGRPRCLLSPRRLVPLDTEAPSREDDDPMAAIEVAVGGGHVVILRGLPRVLAAIDEEWPLVECTLVAFGEEMVAGATTANALAAAAISPTGLAAWEGLLRRRTGRRDDPD